MNIPNFQKPTYWLAITTSLYDKTLARKRQPQPKAKLKDNVLITLTVNKLRNSQTNVILQIRSIYVNHEVRL